MGKKEIKIILILAILIALTFFVLFFVEKSKYTGYTKIQAKIIGISTTTGSKPSTSKTYTYYLDYRYEYEGESYTATKRVFTKIGKKTDTYQTIRINPDNPQEIENTFTRTSYLLTAVFIGLFSLLLYLSNFKRKF